jgi:hypothetical protein
MDTLETKREEMFLRVSEYGSQFAATFPAESYGAELFARLRHVIEELKGHAISQLRGTRTVRQSSAGKAAARDELWRRIEAISRTARVMAYTLPNLEDKFRATRGIGDQALLILARAFATEAAPFKAEFIKRGMSADFIEELNEQISVFETAINHKAQGRGAHVAASAAIDDLIERGMRIVRELDALVRNVFNEDPSALAVWASASHVERPTRRGKQKSNGTPEPDHGQD